MSSAAVAEPDVTTPTAPPQEQTQRKPAPSKPKPQPPYAVVLENDDDHTFEYVIELLQRVFGYDLAKAFELTKTVHETGEAVVWSGTMEVAELKRDQVRGYGPDFFAMKVVKFPLGVRIEPLAG